MVLPFSQSFFFPALQSFLIRITYMAMESVTATRSQHGSQFYDADTIGFVVLKTFTTQTIRCSLVFGTMDHSFHSLSYANIPRRKLMPSYHVEVKHRGKMKLLHQSWGQCEKTVIQMDRV